MTADTRSFVHLVGSFPCRSAEEVFTLCGRELDGHLRRVPDGEAHGWLNFSTSALSQAKGLERASEEDVYAPAYATPAQLREYHERAHTRERLSPKLRIRPGLAASDIEFAPLGYDRVALDSYAAFKRAQAQGVLPRNVRFQVGFPTPFATLASVLGARDVQLALPRMEETFFREVDAIAAQIPHEELAIQWEVAVEVVTVLERHAPPLAQTFSPEDIAAALARACERVPSSVQAGVHLCYGNPGGKHIVEPRDTAVMVSFANRLFASVARPIQWLHMPVPIARDDAGYFAPLGGLRLPPETELFLGLVHPQDGLEGAQRRMRAARAFAPVFGVATECGLRFYPSETLPQLLALHRRAAEANQP